MVSHLLPLIGNLSGCVLSLVNASRWLFQGMDLLLAKSERRVSSGREPKELFSQQLTRPFAGITPLIVPHNRDKSLFSAQGKRIEARTRTEVMLHRIHKCYVGYIA